MFLKKIEIIGFKSFAKKTVLDFSDSGVFGNKNIGITTIVGPNGSGKSNVADALKWVMGEQSMKSVRGKKAGDIIFAGSDKKSRLGSAQVSIYLDNSKKKIPIDFEEVIITRKVYQSGEGEYFINKSKVRLVDVIDLLAKAGIGQRSYCIVNQGMADQILNASLLERRAIIEEAAGVKEFQVKKERSQRKLKSTGNNLKQVEGLLKEIEPHLNLLKRQSGKAQKGDQYRKELKERQNRMFGFLWRKLKEDRSEADEKKAELGREMMKIQREVDDLVEKIKKESKNTVSMQDEISQLEEKQRQTNHQLNLAERQLMIEEGKLELEKEKVREIRKVEILPVNTAVIRNCLAELKTKQKELIKKIDAVENLKALQAVREYAQDLTVQLNDLLEAVSKGRFEKKISSTELESQKAVNLKKVNSLMENVGKVKKERDELSKKQSDLAERIAQLIDCDKKERRAVIDLEDELRRKQFELEKLKDQFNEAKIVMARFEVREEDLQNRIKNEMKVVPSQLVGQGEKVDVFEEEQKISRLKVQLEQIGGIDESIIEEYQETQERYDFLQGESRDLAEASKKLKKIIKEMDEQIKTKFEETYKHINREFGKYFSIIFNGGKASLKKVEVKTVQRKKEQEGEEEDDKKDLDSLSQSEEDETETQIGVEISAVPPGKKINSLGMLSGGERALTSIALLFAIISHNPPPFALLDEVEAALDEANSKRFGRILKELSGQTQFVLITHNRQTMREAALLYGVTMSGDGISKLLSVKLEQVGEKGEISK